MLFPQRPWQTLTCTDLLQSNSSRAHLPLLRTSLWNWGRPALTLTWNLRQAPNGLASPASVAQVAEGDFLKAYLPPVGLHTIAVHDVP